MSATSALSLILSLNDGLFLYDDCAGRGRMANILICNPVAVLLVVGMILGNLDPICAIFDQRPAAHSFLCFALGAGINLEIKDKRRTCRNSCFGVLTTFVGGFNIRAQIVCWRNWHCRGGGLQHRGIAAGYAGYCAGRPFARRGGCCCCSAGLPPPVITYGKS
ncbi:hypothetical protein KCP73_07220 [Salmonella enterica subsp. enterica]|nr:hypothetical protein KCP73_07220 [Salmonella enterica subsp. enterica]